MLAFDQDERIRSVQYDTITRIIDVINSFFSSVKWLIFRKKGYLLIFPKNKGDRYRPTSMR